jgi:uncharacterized spore protein YtfJ
MEQAVNLLKTAVAELERLLDARHVLGEPIQRGDVTVIPFVSYGFGFGAGGGSGAGGGGTGAGGGIRPLGAIIIDAQGVRIESIQSGLTGVAATLAATVVRAVDAGIARRKTGDGGS